MRGVLGVAACGGWARRGLPPDIADRLLIQVRRVLAASELPLHVDVRFGPGRRSVLIAWAQGPAEPPADLLTSGPGGCVAHTGYFSESDALVKLAQGMDLHAFTADAGGCFSIYRDTGGVLEAATVASGIDQVFTAKTSKAIIVSSRALVAHLTAQSVLLGTDRPSVRLDHLGMREMMQAGFCVTEATIFQDVRALPASAVLTASGGRVRIGVHEQERVPAAAVQPGSREWETRMDALADAAMRAVEPARRTELPAYLGLSGGRDSRMVVAALSAAGITVRTGSTGPPTHPDVIVGTRLATTLGLAHHVMAATGAKAAGDTFVVQHPVEQARQVVWSTDGMVSALDVPRLATKYLDLQVSMSGSGGEVARGGYFCTEDDASVARAVKIVDNLYGRHGWLRGSRFDELARAQRYWRGEVTRDHMNAMDLIYLRYRAGRWIASNRAATVTQQLYLHPMLDNGFVRRSLAFPVEYRYSEHVSHALVERLAPSISEFPLAFRRYRSDVEPAPGTAQHAAWVQRAPVLLDQRVTAPDWRKVLPGNLREKIGEQLLSPGAAELYEVGDRRFIERLVSDTAGVNVLQLWRLLPLSILADGSWETARPGDLEPLTIPRPQPAVPVLSP